MGYERRQVEHDVMNLLYFVGLHFITKPLLIDEDNSTVFLEYLPDYRPLRCDIIKTEVDYDEAMLEMSAKCLAVLHTSTHITNPSVSLQQFNQWKAQFQNSHALNTLADFFFVKPYNKDDTSNVVAPLVMEIAERELFGNSQVLKTIKEFRRKFVEDKECIVHGDFNMCAAMTNGNYIKMIDFEYSHVGSGAVDVFRFIEPMMSMAIYHRYLQKLQNCNRHEGMANKLVNTCETFVRTYLKNLTFITGSREEYIKRFLADVSGFLGCVFIARTIGVNHLEFVKEYPEIEKACFLSGLRLLKQHEHINDINALIDVAVNSI